MSIIRVTLLIAVFNLMTFGNGPVMIPLLESSLVEEARVLTQEQLLYAFTIARVTPGQANTYVASIGYMLHGWPGAILAAVVIVLPGYFMLAALKGYERVQNSRWIGGFTRGLTATSVGLILAAVVRVGEPTLNGAAAWIAFAAMIAMTQLLRWNIFVALAAASSFGLAAQWWLGWV